MTAVYIYNIIVYLYVWCLYFSFLKWLIN